MERRLPLNTGERAPPTPAGGLVLDLPHLRNVRLS